MNQTTILAATVLLLSAAPAPAETDTLARAAQITKLQRQIAATESSLARIGKPRFPHGTTVYPRNFDAYVRSLNKPSAGTYAPGGLPPCSPQTCTAAATALPPADTAPGRDPTRPLYHPSPDAGRLGVISR